MSVQPEKIVTFAIAVFLMKRLFPNDVKTLGKLREMSAKIKAGAKSLAEKNKEKTTEESDKKE